MTHLDGKYHRVERQEKQVHAAHLYEELQRLRKENARLQEEREILNKAAASFAQPLPCSTPGSREPGNFPSVVYVGSWRSRAVAPRSGVAAHPTLPRTLKWLHYTGHLETRETRERAVHEPTEYEAGANGLITSNFFVSGAGEVTDNHFGIIFVP